MKFSYFPQGLAGIDYAILTSSLFTTGQAILAVAFTDFVIVYWAVCIARCCCACEVGIDDDSPPTSIWYNIHAVYIAL